MGNQFLFRNFDRDQVFYDQTGNVKYDCSPKEDHKCIDRKNKIPEGNRPPSVPAFMLDQEVKKSWQKCIGNEDHREYSNDGRDGYGLQSRVFGKYQHPYPNHSGDATQEYGSFIGNKIFPSILIFLHEAAHAKDCVIDTQAKYEGRDNDVENIKPDPE